MEPRQIGSRRRLNARGLRQPRQKLLIRFTRVAPHHAAQRRGGFERRSIEPDRLALDEIGGRQDLQDPREHRAMRLRRRVRDIVECSGGVSNESAVRHAMPCSESIPSKSPINSSRKYVSGVRLGRPRVFA